MNYLVIILLALVLIRGKNESLDNLLSSITVEDALPLLQLFGINSEHLQAITNILPNLMSGELDLLAIIKNLAPLIATFNQTSNQSNTPPEVSGIDNIKDIAPDEILQNIQDYFA